MPPPPHPASKDAAPPRDRYARAFAAARARGEVLFMPYLTAGYPTRAETVPLCAALFAGGAGALELGVPFSDPLADGPVIQRANTVALQHATDLAFVLEVVRRLRADGVAAPITLMGYLNPFLAYGVARQARDEAAALELLARDVAAAGADGLIVVDLPAEESDPLRAALRRHGLALIYLLAPTSTPERIRAVAGRASGFVYLVSVTGVTGARSALPPDLVEFVARVRAGIGLPLALGFGISSRAQVETVAELCEAAVIGSAVIQAVDQASPDARPAALQRFAQEITGRRRDQTA